jgi:hypothetical protein
VYFELKLDNHWTSLFWKFSKKNEKVLKKLVDPYIMQFWNRYLLNSHIVNSVLSQDAIENDPIFKELYGYQGDDFNIKYNDFDLYKTLLGGKNRIKDIEKVFESLAFYLDEVSEIIKPNWDKNDKWNLFSEAINQRQRIILFATTIFLETHPFDTIKFRNWIRIVWNIIIDPNIRSVPAMAGAMRFISELAKYSNEIYTFLNNPESVLFSRNTTFQTQLEEEHFKSILISKSSEWEESIIEAESHPLFQGNIRFLLTDNSDTDYEYFQKMRNTSFAILKDNDLSDKAENYLWIRALLAKSTDIQLPITLSNRFNNWRYLINSSLMNGMRTLIDDILSKNIPASDCMAEICLNYRRDDSKFWVFPLVSWIGNNGETLLGNFSVTRNVQYYKNNGNDPEHVYLYNQTRWTDGNILLSNFRNEIVQELINFSPDIFFPSQWHNIQDKFFRGGSIELKRLVNGIQFTYYLDKEYIRIRINSNEEKNEHLKDIDVESKETLEEGFFTRKYDFGQIRSFEEVNVLIKKIEKEIFDLSNNNSLMSKIQLSTFNNR